MKNETPSLPANPQIYNYGLRDLFRFAQNSGIVGPDEVLSAHNLGRASKVSKDPEEQLISMEFVNPESGNPLTSREFVEKLAQAHGLESETIDSLKLDPKLVTGVIGKDFARKRLILPIRYEDDCVVVAIANPIDDDAVQMVAGLVTKPILLKLVYAGELLQIITEHYGLRENLRQANKSVQTAASRVNNLEQLLHIRSEKELEKSEEHVVNAVEYLFKYAIDQGASDIHFEPKRTDGQVRLRIDGIMHTINVVPMHVFRALTSRIKTISRMDIAERRRPQDGRIKISGGSDEIEMRVSTLPVVFGEKVVLRIFDPNRVVDSFEELGFSEHHTAQLHHILRAGSGMLLITGPTGSGKSTTLYCGLRQLAQQPINIVTVEDPVEMIIETVNQVPVQANIGLGFAESLRTILRQDPDVIMIGEIRDAETARYAVQAALTGHLVLSTLHTNDAYSAIGRLRDLGVDRFFLAQVIRGLTAQRLVRKNCTVCSMSTMMEPAEADMLGIKEITPGMSVTRGQGCESCRFTGYRGRTTINEILFFTPEIANLIYEAQKPETVLEAARKSGFISLQETAQQAVLNGITSLEEAVRVLSGSVQ